MQWGFKAIFLWKYCEFCGNSIHLALLQGVAALPEGGGGMVMSTLVTLPSVDRGGLISASLPTAMIASFDTSIYLFATRVTSAAVTFSIPALYFSSVSAG